MPKKPASGAKRSTKQSRAIEAIFLETDRPLTIPEVHDLAEKSCPKLGIATVYRSVSRLMESNWLEEVNLPNLPVRYERAELHHHHHFHCKICDTVTDVEAPCSTLTSSIPEGYTVHSHEVTFYGVCPACS